jgi:hypothetical protein
LTKTVLGKYLAVFIGCCLVVIAAIFLLSLIRSVPRGPDQGAPASETARQEGHGTARLSWEDPAIDSNNQPIVEIAGYNVYVGKDPNNLTLRTSVKGPRLTSYEVGELATPGTYYFAITAYTESGAESAKSNIARKTF